MSWTFSLAIAIPAGIVAAVMLVSIFREARRMDFSERGKGHWGQE